MSDLRYPIGAFAYDSSPHSRQARRMDPSDRRGPVADRAAVSGLTERQFDTPYRPGGWTVRQVLHHVPDSHLNAYCRYKFALTEDNPTIKPYDEAAWANVADTPRTRPEVSLALLDALHARWVVLLESMSRPTSGGRSSIPSAGRSRSTGCCSSTRGMDATTPRT